MKATFKVKVLQGETPPEPSFVGTRITIDVPAETLRWGANSLTLDAGSSGITIDWGDGTVETFTGSVSRHVHNYERPGIHKVTISDDVRTIMLSTTAGDFKTIYAPMIKAFEARSSKLKSIGGFGMIGLVNMTTLDIRETTIDTIGTSVFLDCTSLASLDGLPRGLTKLANSCFKNCTGIVGKVYLPHVNSVSGTTSSSAPFAGCTGITEIHFSEENRAAIETSSIYQVDNRLGAPNATLFFDP